MAPPATRSGAVTPGRSKHPELVRPCQGALRRRAEQVQFSTEKGPKRDRAPKGARSWCTACEQTQSEKITPSLIMRPKGLWVYGS
jgi:hypothetical protein